MSRKEGEVFFGIFGGTQWLHRGYTMATQWLHHFGGFSGVFCGFLWVGFVGFVGFCGWVFVGGGFCGWVFVGGFWGVLWVRHLRYFDGFGMCMCMCISRSGTLGGWVFVGGFCGWVFVGGFLWVLWVFCGWVLWVLWVRHLRYLDGFGMCMCMCISR